MTAQADTEAMSGAGDITEAMFNDWARDYRPLLASIANGWQVRSGLAADDLMQEGLLRCWLYTAPKWQAEANMVTWLIQGYKLGIRSHVSRTLGRGKVDTVSFDTQVAVDRQSTLTDQRVNVAFDRAEVMAMMTQIEQDVAEACLSLTPVQMKWTQLRFWEDMTAAEIEKATGIPMSTWARVKRKLGKRLPHLREVV